MSNSTYTAIRQSESGLDGNSTLAIDVGVSVGQLRQRFGAAMRIGADHVAFVFDRQVTDDYMPRAGERVLFKLVAKGRGLAA